MRPLTVLVAVVIAAAIGLGLYALHDGGVQLHVPASAISTADPLPEGSIELTIAAAGLLEPQTVEPGTVFEITYSGAAAEGHQACAHVETLSDGEWTRAYWLGSAVDGNGGAHRTSDAEVEPDHTILCNMMVVVTTGPERLRLPLLDPNRPARLCVGSGTCIPLEYE